MKKKIVSFIGHLIDGMFIGTAITYALMEKWDLAFWHAISGLIFTAIDVLGMVWRHKEETKGELTNV